VEVETASRMRFPRSNGLGKNGLDNLTRFLQNSTSLNGSESGGVHLSPARFFASFGPSNHVTTQRGEGKEELHDSTDSVQNDEVVLVRFDSMP
jgi:hypothetical protein